MHISPLIIFVVPYLIIIVSFILGWRRLREHVIVENSRQPLVSILIPIRNEAQNLQALISGLENQDYPQDKFEVIFIDDHSDDGSLRIIHSIKNLSSMRVISLDSDTGKKAALWNGINAALGELIITTDGDCCFPRAWISTMAGYYLQYPDHLLIGPVFLKGQKGLLGHFQNLEFLSLIASGAGAAGIDRPILCNGANLAASKTLFMNAANVYQSAVASGDDIFLLLELKRQGFRSMFVKTNNAAVVTEGTSRLGRYIKQRSRWTFKSRFYRDPDIIIVAVVVLFTNLFLLGELFYSMVNLQYLDDFSLFYLLKCIVDYILLCYVARFFNRKHLLRNFIIHQFLYLVYVSFIGIAGHFIGETWKNRYRYLTKK
jgi:cellulose synthase/poly-beta-1,6-N-acetylglucosamine synthase-like glycosyltransferase